MTPEAQRIAIAEACGWHWTGTMWACPDGSGGFIGSWGTELFPDYLNDLNAMHEAEKVLTSNEHVNGYYRNLCDVVSPGGNMQIDGMLVICATAAQRAEAFLRTLGLWEES